MFGLEALDLARIQFTFTVSFHIIFPSITIGLSVFLVYLEGLWLRTDNPVYRDLYHFWAKVFAVTFGMGVVSGIVMAFQFGTNWSRFSEFSGSITGPLLTYEVLTAFFLEAGFLGVMLFGWQKVGRGLHFFATCMVALGTVISAFWILASNSWMQTPQGFEIIDGRVMPLDWFDVIFTPSFPYRLTHMVVAAFLGTSLFVTASGAWQLLKKRNTPTVRRMFSLGLWMTFCATILQVYLGDLHGLNTLEHQPEKIAALEGHWENVGNEPSPLILVGWPDMQQEKTLYSVEIPVLGSIILTHSTDKQIPALKDYPPEDRPNSTIVFWSFRIMVGMGILMLIMGFWSVWLRYRDRLYDSRLFHHFAFWMGPAGLVAILAGWVTTEVGRQPWLIYHVMRTADGVSFHNYAQLSFVLILFVIVYFVLFGVGTGYVFLLLNKGPLSGEGRVDDTPDSGRPARPLSAVSEKTNDPIGNPPERS